MLQGERIFILLWIIYNEVIVRIMQHRMVERITNWKE
jgi:hypothetical protein